MCFYLYFFFPAGSCRLPGMARGSVIPSLQSFPASRDLTSPVKTSLVYTRLSSTVVTFICCCSVSSCNKNVIQSFLRWSKIVLLWNCCPLLLISLTVASFVPFSAIFEVYILCITVEICALPRILIFLLKLGEFYSLSTWLICRLCHGKDLLRWLFSPRS